jgi:hypothetical protein
MIFRLRCATRKVSPAFRPEAWAVTADTRPTVPARRARKQPPGRFAAYLTDVGMVPRSTSNVASDFYPG